ncbi:DoxX-like protein [Pseudonocardia sediminis]|uniref:DoxX-like protein n=1 Tax=Pseudonocardia sediminis TaxID=1397368 RepID=A0A4Q7UZQ2_PSEST|nr:DoxX family protein [Pseudonocardia sediminis]RZT86608.1 DoxX-like protein [Pseudonocardia sediminis]
MTAIAATSSTTAGRRPGRTASVALWVGQVLVAAALLFASIPKVTLDPMAVEGFAAIGFSPTGTLVIGLLEIAGAIGLLVPRLTGLAALCTVALMIGAVTVTVVFMGAALAVLPAVIGVIAALVAYGRRHSTVQLAAWVRTRR